MKVAELEGAQLDAWVARALGFPSSDDVPNELCGWEHIESESFRKDWSPSQDWGQGGPIIEREGIAIAKIGECWSAYMSGAQGGYFSGADMIQVCAAHRYSRGSAGMPGSTPLIAAMRAYVASKFGDEVDDS